MIHIRNIIESDFESVVRLNDTEVQQTSQMDLDRLRLLVQMSSYCKVALFEGQVVAFLIALREGRHYESDNYIWFASRHPRYLYVDRIVVSAGFSGNKIGTKLYGGLFEFAQSRGVEIIACEYNIEPPNPGSRMFHNNFGFREVGTQWVAGGTKRVSLQVAET